MGSAAVCINVCHRRVRSSGPWPVATRRNWRVSDSQWPLPMEPPRCAFLRVCFTSHRAAGLSCKCAVAAIMICWVVITVLCLMPTDSSLPAGNSCHQGCMMCFLRSLRLICAPHLASGHGDPARRHQGARDAAGHRPPDKGHHCAGRSVPGAHSQGGW